jgi:hypothetical protein
MAVFWDVSPCSLVGTDRRFRGVDDGGIKLLRNVGQYPQTTRHNIIEDGHFISFILFSVIRLLHILGDV